MPGSENADRAVPRYSHIFVIMEENKDYAQIMSAANAPHIGSLAKTYGVATRFYAEVHPSEPNYVALVGGDTFGIHDDDAFYCKPGMKNAYCEKSAQPGYVEHTINAPNLSTQLDAAGLSWKGYYESIPAPGSKAIVAGDPRMGPAAAHWELYASKHSAFMNFASVQHSPRITQHIVGFDQMNRDLASGNMPAFALIVPNQCNEMHGLDPSDYTPAVAKAIPADCNHDNVSGLIRRGDAYVGKLVGKIQSSRVWTSTQNAAVVITFDEGAGEKREGCCGIDPKSAANFGGGHIPTIVITNHGPRGVADSTPYSHYSLLRTIEDAFGIHTYLAHAADTSNGVRPMVKLFR
jgi:phospholipase C